jgi:hypothetical protein
MRLREVEGRDLREIGMSRYLKECQSIVKEKLSILAMTYTSWWEEFHENLAL